MTMLDFVFKNSTSDESFKKSFFGGVLKVAIAELKLKGKIEISLNLVSGTEIRGLNKKYRNKDKETDVLSFPLEEKEVNGILTVGDIFICLPFAKDEAKRQDIGMEKELAQLTVHGFLHLLGYDHETTKADAVKMSRLENRILNKQKLY